MLCPSILIRDPDLVRKAKNSSISPITTRPLSIQNDILLCKLPSVQKLFAANGIQSMRKQSGFDKKALLHYFQPSRSLMLSTFARVSGR